MSRIQNIEFVSVCGRTYPAGCPCYTVKRANIVYSTGWRIIREWFAPDMPIRYDSYQLPWSANADRRIIIFHGSPGRGCVQWHSDDDQNGDDDNSNSKVKTRFWLGSCEAHKHNKRALRNFVHKSQPQPLSIRSLPHRMVCVPTIISRQHMRACWMSSIPRYDMREYRFSVVVLLNIVGNRRACAVFFSSLFYFFFCHPESHICLFEQNIFHL